MGDLTLEPNIGNVAFGAGKDQWAFTLRTFAKIFSKKYGIAE
jgi:elongation factor 2